VPTAFPKGEFLIDYISGSNLEGWFIKGSRVGKKVFEHLSIKSGRHRMLQDGYVGG
jgi:hypothetical protein